MKTYAFYIYSAWGISLIVLMAMIASIWLDSRRLQRDLKRLEAQGIRRRSSQPASGERS